MIMAMLKEHNILILLRIISAVEIIGGFVCISGILLLNSGFSLKLLESGIVTDLTLRKFYVYLWISTGISFLLAYGILKRRNWARILLIFFAVFGIINFRINLSCGIFTAYLPFIPEHLRNFLVILKNLIFILIDLVLIYFFTRRQVAEVFISRNKFI